MSKDTYYGVTRTDEYLAHYGIKGMKWGVRKAIASGNSARLGRQYKKAQKKLAKLEARAANGKKYAKRAAGLAAGAAAAGGAAALGVHGAGKVVKKATAVANKFASPVGLAMQRTGNAIARKTGANGLTRGLVRNGLSLELAGKKGTIAAAGKAANTAMNSWGASNTIGKGIRRAANTGLQAVTSTGIGAKATRGINNALRAGGHGGIGQQLTKLGGRSNAAYARIGAGAAAAGLAGAAGYNAYRAATTKRAARKAAQFRSEMNKAFAGTQYGKKPRQGNKRRRG